MSDFNFLALQAQLVKFTNDVEANRVHCGSDFARAVHDTLLGKLSTLIRSCEEGGEATTRLALTGDAASREALEDEIGNVIADIEQSGFGTYPVALIDEATYDRNSGSFIHPIFAVSCNRAVIETAKVSNEDLGGLGTIIDRLASEVGLRFTALRFEAGDATFPKAASVAP